MSSFYQSVASPLAQTFFVKRNMTQGASCVFLGEVDLYFNAKSATRGVTVEIRTVVNGYPTKEVLPFARKWLASADVSVSDTGVTATSFTFDNPIKLLAETEYALVIIPDANDPDYVVYTAITGNTDLSTQTPITQDWGDGVLFASTNNSAWKSQQTEDLKFTLKRYEFTTSNGHVNLVPKDVEFFTISGAVNSFRQDEIAYVEKGSPISATLTGSEVSIANNTPGFAVGDYIVLKRGGESFVSKVEDLVEAQPETTIDMSGPAFSLTSNTANNALTATLAVGGRVTYYDKATGTRLYLKESSARTGSLFQANTTINGALSGAYATIETIDNYPLSFIQPIVFVHDGTKTNTDAQSYDGITFDQNLTLGGNNFLLGEQRYINSKSNDGGADSDFIVRINMTNNGFTRTSPIVDVDMSLVHAYKYDITDTEESSAYVAKEVVLQDDMSAAGLKVLLSAYRPIGTMVDVYARFVYTNNVDTRTDWILLDNSSPNLYSNPSDVYDYRDYSYDLDEDVYTQEFLSFQIKIVLRHATTAELGDLNIIPSVNLFPHINDYRAIAIT